MLNPPLARVVLTSYSAFVLSPNHNLLNPDVDACADQAEYAKLTLMKLSELAEKTGARFDSNDADIEIEGAAGLDQAQPGSVTFLSNPRYTSRVNSTGASAIYVGEDTKVDRENIAVLRAKDSY